MNTEITKKAIPNLYGKIKQVPRTDTTLTKEGYSADAKTVGDKFAEHKLRIDNIDPHFAKNVGYDNASSGLSATNVQAAIDKMVEEYENPPMMLWEEYRTREKWMGKPVYTKLVSYTPSTDIGTANGYHGFAITVSTSYFKDLIRYCGSVNMENGNVIPNINADGGYFGVNFMNGNGVALATNKKVIPANTTIYLQLWYTKTTD